MDDATIERAADDAAANASKDMTPEDIASDMEQFTAHLESMRSRGLVTEEMEATLKAADDEAAGLEAQAQAYEAAMACELGVA